jgi:hypothetical protein
MLHASYICGCATTTPLIHACPQHGAEETGICSSCTGIYDERLFEARTRQHVENYHWDSVHEYLMEVQPHYKMINS